jgi:hypothetical protein
MMRFMLLVYPGGFDKAGADFGSAARGGGADDKVQ